MKYSMDGHIKIGDTHIDVIINIPEESNITAGDIDYIKPFIKNEGKENEIKMPAIEMFMTAMCDFVRIPVSNVIKTIEVKNKIYDAGLPGIVVELGDCIKAEQMK